MTGFRIAAATLLILCFVALPLLLFALWFFELGRTAQWEIEMCLAPWLPGLFFAWFFSQAVDADG